MHEEPLLVRALRSEEVERPPVWLMRQAGRYLEEYRELKARHSFSELCRSSELGLEVSLQPIRAFGMDAAIVFSDILVPAQALGFEVTYKPGPVVQNPIRNAADVDRLRLQISHSPTWDTIRLLRTALDTAPDRKAVIGFAGAPWTLASYLIDQGAYKNFHGTSVFAQTRRAAFTRLLNLLTDFTIEYLSGQIENGAHVVQLFDTWGGNLSASDYRELSLPSIARICGAIRSVPTILYVGISSHLLEAMAESGASCLSIDWRTDLRAARERTVQVVQGNLDPTHLFRSQADVRTATAEMLRLIDCRRGYIANLGHGVLPGTPRESVGEFVRTVQDA